MARPANRPRMLQAVVAPLLLSFVAHGLLLLVLWLWPTRTRTPLLAIESTRITLDLCSLDSGPAAKNSGELPADAHTAEDDRDFTPRLEEAPAAPTEPLPSAAPVLVGGGPSAPAGGGVAPSVGARGGCGSLFPLPATAASVVYVLDRSVSMGINDKLDLACRELLAELRRLPPAARFQIIAYNTYAETLSIDGQRGLLPAEPALIEQASAAVTRLTPTGNTDHANALHRGLLLHPDVLHFITDADDLTTEQVESITRCNRGTVIHTIELTRRREGSKDGPLARLARDNHGTYRRVSLSAVR